MNPTYQFFKFIIKNSVRWAIKPKQNIWDIITEERPGVLFVKYEKINIFIIYSA